MKECIVILGMHRSGTSVLAGLVSFFDAYLGSDLMQPTDDNPKGYFENNKIYQLNEKILRENNASWHDFSFVVEDIDKNSYQQYILEAKIIINNDLKYVKRMLIKDPRICILFPIWEQALRELDIKIHVIFVYRSPLEVAQSLSHRDEMALEKGLMLWSHYFLQAEKFSGDYNRLIIEFDHDFEDISDLLNRVGCLLNVPVSQQIVEKAQAFYSPALKHHKISFDNISTDIPIYLSNLIRIIIEKKFNKKKVFDEIRNEFKYSKNMFLYNRKQQEATIINQKELLDQATLKLKASHLQNRKITQDIVESKKEKESMTSTICDLKKNITSIREEYKRELVNKNIELKEEKEKLKNYKTQLKLTKNELNDKLGTFSDKENSFKRELQEKTNHNKEIIKGLAVVEQSYREGDSLFTKLLNQGSEYKKLRNNPRKMFKQVFFQSLIPFLDKKTRLLSRDRAVIADSGLFSSFFYLTSYPDVGASGIDPLLHFCSFGWKEGRSPSLQFDLRAYLRKYPDVERANINPLLHYVKNGKKEGRLIDTVSLYGKNTIIFENNSAPVNESINENKIPPKIIEKCMRGPVFENYHTEKTSVVFLLRKTKKLVNRKVPANVLSFSKKQLEILPLKISVVMPTWNRAGCVCDAIDSILSQSYQAFEIIVSDDGSTDNTIDLIKTTYSKHILNKQIRILSNNHLGVSAARNIALEEVKGDLVAYLDSDNIWREHYLLLMAAAFSENDEIICAYSALEKNDYNKKTKTRKNSILATPYNREKLLHANFIDLNVFMHKVSVYKELGGFDTKLKRLVDWELIIRYTKNYSPAFIPFVGVDYFLDDKLLKNITTTVSLDDNRQRVYDRHFRERLKYNLVDLRLAYVLWDFPALSQTFVMEELKWLVANGYDVVVYYSVTPDKCAILDFDVDAYLVKDAEELADLFGKHQRNLCHTHFAYPTTTLLTYPACVKTNINFTFMPHAVDIFHHENKKRNKIAEIARHPLCLKVFVHGEFHKNFIEKCGVPCEKIAFNIQAVNTSDFEKYKPAKIKENNKKRKFKGIVISRFVEKKGISTLINAASLLKNEEVTFDIYGYGPLEEDYKKQIEKLGLDNVSLKGVLINQQDVAKAYEDSDFLIAPCITAENGDMDGFPTVILEAMAVGLPVITTDIAAIPDYLTDGINALISPADDIDQLAARVRYLMAMPREQKLAMVKRSQDFLTRKIGTNRTLQMLLDTWLDYTLDIFLVTFNTEKYENREDTFEIINRIFKFTTTPFTLTIIDNNSDEGFWGELCEKYKSYSNVRFIRKYENKFCGSASNTALHLSNSEFAIYVCSKEGFIKKHGWERVLLDHMRSNPAHAMAGYCSQMPKYIYGKEYEAHPDFSKFRNPHFARENPNRVFKHIQGGVFIISRQFIKKHGGFNSEIPHGGMDIEMSYFIESLGYKLGEIPEVASLTVKTLPKLLAILNENTVIAHPLTKKTVTNTLDDLEKENGKKCNICGWKGDLFNKNLKEVNQQQICPYCRSTGFGRSIYKLLANSHHIYRNETCAILSNDLSLEKSLGKLFRPLFITSDAKLFFSTLQSSSTLIDCIILDPELIKEKYFFQFWGKLEKKLSPLGEIIFADSLFLNIDVGSNYAIRADENFRLSDEFIIDYYDFTSYCIAYDWRRFGVINRV